MKITEESLLIQHSLVETVKHILDTRWLVSVDWGDIGEDGNRIVLILAPKETVIGD